MTRKMYAIQVSDFRGNWVTVKHASILNEKGVLEELEREQLVRGRNLRAIELATGEVAMELYADNGKHNVNS